MNILLIGAGGREHALAWKLAQSPLLDTLFASPGNPGIAEHAVIIPVDATDHGAMVRFCCENSIDLVVIGPEGPLVDGLADSLRAHGIAVFGPDKAAAQLEGSKAFTKQLCAEAAIPTARYRHCTSQTEALAALADFALPVVIKADGLAAGKGVVIALAADDARAAIATMFGGGFGAAGAAVVIEDFMTGEEVSFFALTDGTAIMPFASAQDHKRVGDGDTGPNTGGMGAYSPAPVMSPAIEARVMAEIIAPTVALMAARGTPFSGVLFAGLMLTADGPKLIEYNARFGDPETQAMMLRCRGDLVPLLMAVATGQLAAQPPVDLAPDSAVSVVMAATGYPATPVTGGAITAIAEAQAHGAKIFHAGTRRDGAALVAAGGRVLAVTAMAATISAARDAAYDAVDRIKFPTGFCRRDIGWREVARQPQIFRSDTD
jgi:phosphoribosylamine---glycine ligase